MRNFILFVALLLSSSCAMNHGKPIANLKYLGVDRYLDRNIYQVRFASDVDVVDLFTSKISQALICSFGDDLDFSVSHAMDSYGEGSIESIVSSKSPEFRADVLFFERKDATSEKVLDSEGLKSRLLGREFLVCKVRINSYSYKVYLSEEMRLPVADLLREVEKFK
ncbi:MULTISPECIES: hypothetical protein [unclassified Pseudomonas]|uniref:hypothetical protein n=1 Tax=unclassified Pseudomonas TaxID=196821 RepID=UPI00111C90A3|nr:MULTISPECIES: hypothetical protein [unclassified Pseudomonas]